MPMPVKRALFQTPMRSNKRRKSSPRKMTMRVPKSLMPEVKQYRSGPLSATVSTAVAVLAPPSQGDGGANFIGSKFRILRMRIFYDYSGLTLSEGVRISVIIPKDPTASPGLTNVYSPWDTQEETVLYDMLLPNDPSTLSGTFDVKGPINVEKNTAGTAYTRNPITLHVRSLNNGSNLASRCNFTVWYTDA